MLRKSTPTQWNRQNAILVSRDYPFKQEMHRVPACVTNHVTD
jgi:hypothetical protein